MNACRNKDVKRIICASSIHVYDFVKRYKNKEKITNSTPITPNNYTYPPNFVKRYKNKEKITNSTPITPNNYTYPPEQRNTLNYSISKICSEKLVELYCKSFNISGLNLRFGAVRPENKPGSLKWMKSIWLSHEDLIEIIKRAINFKGFDGVCVCLK